MTQIHETISALELIAVDEPHRFQYLELHRLHLRNHYPDGTTSRTYTVEATLRKNLDAVAILLFSPEANIEETQVYLRRTLRPALALRSLRHTALRPPEIIKLAEKPVLLEVIAGILESGDHGEDGIRRRALAEIWEEAGFRVEPQALFSLAAGTFPTPGMNPEIIHLFAAPINPQAKSDPPGDGSPTEEVGGLVAFTLREALSACRTGEIPDAKTEICLHRLKQHLLKG